MVLLNCVFLFMNNYFEADRIIFSIITYAKFEAHIHLLNMLHTSLDNSNENFDINKSLERFKLARKS